MKRLTTQEILDIVKARGFVGGESNRFEYLFRKVFGNGIRFLPLGKGSRRCYACGEDVFWLSRLSIRLTCVKCHPPADTTLVAGYKRGHLEVTIF
ncbi:MAG: hypothetical protein ACP5RW_03565 [bacterium]